MKRNFECFSRFIALALVVTVIFTSCPVVPSPLPPEEPPLVLTPGVGTPCYFFLDSEGNFIESETDGPGRTGLLVKDNELAKGALVYSDDTDYEDRVAFVYKNSIVSMFFKKGNNFPHRMAITDGSDAYYAFLSPYDAVNHTYHATFTSNGHYEMMDNIVLNENIFILYENNPELSDSQNRRMANMTIAMGVWGSLYATIEKQNSAGPGFIIPRGILFYLFKGVAKVFTYVAIAATVVSVVVVPIVTFINPAAGLLLATKMEVIGVTNLTIAAVGLVFLFELLEYGEQTMPPVIPENGQGGGLPIVQVTLPYENNRSVRYNKNGIHEEFHIQHGEGLAVKFYVPGADFSGLTTTTLYQFMYIDEPSVLNGEQARNTSLFEKIPAEVELLSAQEFIVVIKRNNVTGCIGDGKVNFGFVFGSTGEKSLELKVNDYGDGFDFRLPGKDDQEHYKNMVVIYFCMVENCPDI
jgi:hypothetical protein